MHGRVGARGLSVLVGLGLALNLGLLALYYTPIAKTLQGDEYYYVGLANQIAAGRPAVHSPFWPPLYGEVLGRVFTLVGMHRLAMQSLQIAMWLAAGVLIHRTASALTPSPLAALATAALFLLSPELMAFTHFLWPEMVHVVFFVTALWLMVCHPRSLLAVGLSGVFVGLMLLTKLLLVPLAPLVPVAFAVCTTGAWRARVGRTLLLAAMIVLTVAPTMLGNLARQGKLMIADSSMVVLWLGLNPTADHPRALREFMASGPDMDTRNAVYRERIRRQVEAQGILGTVERQLSRQYFQLLHYETWFTLQLPGAPPVMKGRYQFESRAIVRALHLYAHLVHAMLLAGMALGIAALRPRAGGWWNVLLLFLLYNFALFLPLNTNARYFVQMMPAACCSRASACTGWCRSSGGGRPRRDGPSRSRACGWRSGSVSWGSSRPWRSTTCRDSGSDVWRGRDTRGAGAARAACGRRCGRGDRLARSLLDPGQGGRT